MLGLLFMASEFLSILKKRKRQEEEEEEVFLEPKKKKRCFCPVREYRWNLLLMDDRTSPLSRSFVLATSEKWFLSPEQCYEDALLYAREHQYKTQIWQLTFIKIVLECCDSGKETI
jgi:hypothetical protein